MTNRIKIDHILPSDGMGGAEVAARTCSRRPNLKCAVRRLFLNRRYGRKNAGLRRILPGPIFDVLRVVRLTRRREPDVVVASLWKSVPAMVVLRFSSQRRPLVFLLHCAHTFHIFDKLFSKLGIIIADEVWADSRATLEALRVPVHKSTRILSFVTEQFDANTSAHPAPNFVSWGRLSEQKGYDRAIRLIALLVERGVDASLTLFGPDRGTASSLSHLADHLGLGERVKFPGPISHADFPSIAAHYSFFLLPSRHEGMCMAAVEAMQLGLVPVTTPVGEMATYVQPGHTGLLIDPDRLDLTADQLQILLADPAAYAALSAASSNYWSAAPLYAEDFCEAGTALAGREPSTGAFRAA